MDSKYTTKAKVSGTYRAMEIVLGVVALTIGFLALVYPAVFIVSLVVLFGLALMVIGILRLATILPSKELSGTARKTNAVIGVAAVAIAAITLVFPVLATEALVILIGLGLLIYGVGRMLIGGAARRLNSGFRGLMVILGILVVAFSIVVIFFPVIGVYTYAFFIAIEFMLIGIDSLASGIAGVPL
jgi:uncharacterized membrane protein HdeD (DUF308 family)